jgi:hypothetical protein
MPLVDDGMDADLAGSQQTSPASGRVTWIRGHDGAPPAVAASIPITTERRHDDGLPRGLRRDAVARRPKAPLTSRGNSRRLGSQSRPGLRERNGDGVAAPTGRSLPRLVSRKSRPDHMIADHACVDETRA